MKPKEQQFIKIEAPFKDEMSGLAIIKILDKKAQNTKMLKLKFVGNLSTLDVTNSSLETIIFDLKEMIGILDLRSAGYYKIKQGIYQWNLSRYFREEQQIVFKEIKHRLVKPPVLHLLDNKGRCHLYSDTSKFAKSSALYEI